MLPPLSKKKSRDIKDEGACDRPTEEREPRRGRERERRGDRGSFLHNVSGYWRAGSATPWSLPVCLHGYESRPPPDTRGAGAARQWPSTPDASLLLYLLLSSTGLPPPIPVPSLARPPSVPSLGLTVRAPCYSTRIQSVTPKSRREIYNLIATAKKDKKERPCLSPISSFVRSCAVAWQATSQSSSSVRGAAQL